MQYFNTKIIDLFLNKGIWILCSIIWHLFAFKSYVTEICYLICGLKKRYFRLYMVYALLHIQCLLNPPFYRFPLTYSVNGLTVESHSLWFLFMRRWLGCGPPKEKPQAVAVRLQNWRNQTALWPICSATKTFMSIDVTKCVDWEVTLLMCWCSWWCSSSPTKPFGIVSFKSCSLA